MYEKIISQAPMMRKGNREFRIFLRMITQKTLLYSEMFSDLAIINSKLRDDFLRIEKVEHPIAFQFGSSCPETLYKAVKIANDYPYYEFNLNCGCPSDRVQHRKLGAVLMNEPNLVIELLRAMKEGSNGKKITLKHRIGIESKNEKIQNYKEYADLCKFVEKINSKIKIDKYTIHARSAILEGLSPRENREIPSLKYEYVERIKNDFKDIFVELNGKIKSIDEAKSKLEKFDAVMIGRAYLNDPYSFIELDNKLLGGENKILSREEVFLKYINEVEKLESKHYNPRAFLLPLLHLFKGVKNSKKFRESISNDYKKGEKVSQFLLKTKKLLK